MNDWQKWLWGGLGWAMFGPIGGILGYTLGSSSRSIAQKKYTQTKGGDFGVSLLVLCGAVMKADGQVLKSELNFVKQFFIKQFGAPTAQQLMTLFKDILKQDYPLKDVCRQIKRNMDHSARLELIHFLFGLSQADGHVHPKEVEVINTISDYLGINQADLESLKAMFIQDTNAAYKILEIESTATDTEVKKAFRKMASKFHPDKVSHLGDDFQKFAEEKFKKVNEAYQQVKQERNFV